MAEAYLEKRACLNRAKVLLSSGDDAALRYACLELRFCLETVTYDKLRAYASRLPLEVLSRWQPPQAMAALLELEEDAEQDYNLAVARESSPGVRSGPFTYVGHHRSLKLTWLKTAYNALGSVLHVPHVTDGRRRKYDDPLRLRARLNEMVERLEPVVESTLIFTMANVVEYPCSLCRRKSLANAKAVRKHKRTVCLHPDCQAEHRVTEDEKGDLWFSISEYEPKYTCKGCQKETAFPRRRIALGVELACPSCRHKHEIVLNYASLEGEGGA